MNVIKTVYAKEKWPLLQHRLLWSCDFTKRTALAETKLAVSPFLVYLTLFDVGLPEPFRTRLCWTNLDEHEMHSGIYQLSSRKQPCHPFALLRKMEVASSLLEPLRFAHWKPSVPSLMGKSNQTAESHFYQNQATTGAVVDAFQTTSTFRPSQPLVMLVSACRS